VISVTDGSGTKRAQSRVRELLERFGLLVYRLLGAFGVVVSVAALVAVWRSHWPMLASLPYAELWTVVWSTGLFVLLLVMAADMVSERKP
jgi:hypothetical protein